MYSNKIVLQYFLISCYMNIKNIIVLPEKIQIMVDTPSILLSIFLPHYQPFNHHWNMSGTNFMFFFASTFLYFILISNILGGNCKMTGNNVSSNYYAQPPNCSEPTTTTLFEMSLQNCLSSQLYAIQISIGNPPQQVYVQVDTGSNVLWVSTNLANSQYGFYTNQSKTYLNLTEIYSESYVNGGFVNGWYGFDFVSVANTSINVSMNIGFADQVSGLYLPQGIVGVMGVGLTDPQTQPNFLDLAYQQNQIATNTFVLQLLNESFSSSMYYNQISSQMKQKSLFSTVPADSFYWQLEVLGVLAGLNDLTQYSAQTAVIDSGTSIFYLNPQLTQAFISQYLLPSYCNFTEGLNICNCSLLPSLPNITFIFPGVAVSLEPSDYVECFNCTCYVHIYQVNTSPAEILLGDTLFNKYNITFSKSQSKIGFMGPTQEVYGFGMEGNFVQSQWIMMGIVYGWLLLIISGFLICVFLDWRRERKNKKIDLLIEYQTSIKQGKQIVKQRATQMIGLEQTIKTR